MQAEVTKATKRAIVIAAAIGIAGGEVLTIADAPWWLAATFALVTVFIGAIWLPLMLLEPPDRHLHYVHGRALTAAFEHWQSHLPGETPPMTDAAITTWLEARPQEQSSPAILAIEGSEWLHLGRYAEARDRIVRIEPASPFDQFERAVMLAEVDFESGLDGDLEEARRTARAVPGSPGLDATAELAIVEAKRLVVEGKPWAPPIDDAYGQVGHPSWRFIIKVGLVMRATYYGPWIVPAMLLSAMAVLALRLAF